jgi:hypothetical protein
VTTQRISWHPEDRVSIAWTGRVGDLGRVLFTIDMPEPGSSQYALTCDLPGFEWRVYYHEDQDELKDAAERLIAEFIEAVGAVFPDERKL